MQCYAMQIDADLGRYKSNKGVSAWLDIEKQRGKQSEPAEVFNSNERSIFGVWQVKRASAIVAMTTPEGSAEGSQCLLCGGYSILRD